MNNFRLNRYTGEFRSSEAEKMFQESFWDVYRRRLLTALVLGSLTYLFASCIPRPEVLSSYRALMIPLTRGTAFFFIITALIIYQSRSFSFTLRSLIVLGEILLGILESMDHYFYLKSIHKFYDIGTSYLVFYILIFYIVIPNKIKLTIFTSLGISVIFLSVTWASGMAAFSDIFTSAIYFVIVNSLGYTVNLISGRARREHFHHMILLSNEIEQRKKAEEEAHFARRAAEKADRAKSKFLAVINHEIRTPLNVILGGLQLLENSKPTEKQADLISILLNSAESMEDLIRNILDFTEIEQNRVRIRSHSFSLRQLTAKLNDIYTRVLEAKGINFQIETEAGTVDAVRGDLLRLRQILINLLNNAAKFTSKGSVTLSVSLLDQEEDEGLHVRFEITDTGIGIPLEEQKKIVHPYYQAGHSAAWNTEGTGLGLAICAELLDAMGSALEIMSTPGIGSTFGFTLTMKEDPGTERQEENPGKDALETYKLLLIDDVNANLIILRGLLESLGQTVVSAQGSLQGIEAFRSTPFDAVLIDLHMKNKDGVETLTEIRRIQPDIIAFAVSADTRPDLNIRLREAGFSGLLPKPISRAALLSCLKRPEFRNRTETSVTGNVLVDASFQKELHDDLEPEVYRNVLSVCITELETDKVRLKKGIEGKFRDEFIHQIKGIAGNYRLTTLFSLSKHLCSNSEAWDEETLYRILEETAGALKEFINDDGVRS